MITYLTVRNVNGIQWSDYEGFGPSCPCHGKRNMERMGYCLYRCQESYETFRMLVVNGHIAMVPLETGKALEDLK